MNSEYTHGDGRNTATILAGLRQTGGQLVIVLVAAWLLLPAATSVAQNPSAAYADTRSSPDIFALRLVNAAMERLGHDVTYDGRYRRLAYPGGDVPDNIGVCTDLVVRAYRTLGIDLQQLVHEDMTTAFDLYPKRWGASKPDPNIDHRRVPNLQVFFARHGEVLAVTSEPDDYHPGDLVTWLLPGNLPHIGIVTDRYSADGRRPLIVHNIGSGPALDDMILLYEIDEHYRYSGCQHRSSRD